MKETGQATNDSVTLSFSADLRYVRPVRHFITALCTLAEYDEEESQALALVTTEVVNNSIEHGSFGPNDEIDVTLVVTPALFRLEVLDAGRGGEEFARFAVERSKVMPSLEEPRGRGLFLVHRIADTIEVSYAPGRGTRLVVSKARGA